MLCKDLIYDIFAKHFRLGGDCLLNQTKQEHIANKITTASTNIDACPT